MVQYDPAIINQFAESLYLKAEKVVRNYTGRGCFLGLWLGLGLAAVVPEWGTLMAFLAPIGMFGYFGYSAGQSAAFKYKLEAQTALCHAKIEENTRKPV